MKSLNYILIFLFFPIQGFSQEFSKDMNDLKGNVAKVELNFKGSLHHRPYWKYIYFFNDFGKVKEQANYLKGKLMADYHYDYDTSMRLALEKDHDLVNHRDRADTSKHTYITDQANRIQIEKIEINGHLMSIRDSIVYDLYNSPLKYRKSYVPFVKEGKGTIQHYSFDYYENRLVKSSRVTSDNGDLTNTDYEYNDNGDVATIKVHQISTFNGEKVIANRFVKYQYKYDRLGNWIKRYTSIDNGKIELELERKIEYSKSPRRAF